MKKLRFVLSLLMISVMFILPASMSAQADEIGSVVEINNTVASYEVAAFTVSGYGQITTDGVNLRSEPNTSCTVREIMYTNETVFIDHSKSVYDLSGNKWLYCKRSKTGTVGYVFAQYVRIYA